MNKRIKKKKILLMEQKKKLHIKWGDKICPICGYHLGIRNNKFQCFVCHKTYESNEVSSSRKEFSREEKIFLQNLC